MDARTCGFQEVRRGAYYCTHPALAKTMKDAVGLSAIGIQDPKRSPCPTCMFRKRPEWKARDQAKRASG